MKRALLLLLLASSCAFASAPPLLQTHYTWAGQELGINGTVVTINKLVLRPGEKTPWHQHARNLCAIVVEGKIEIELKDGEKALFEEGEAFCEVKGMEHQGANPSRKEKTELIIFDVSE